MASGCQDLTSRSLCAAHRESSGQKQPIPVSARQPAAEITRLLLARFKGRVIFIYIYMSTALEQADCLDIESDIQSYR